MRKLRSLLAARQLTDSLSVLLLAGLLIGPLFRLEYLNNFGSIESTFIADARFLREHWPHPDWQPLWYCGTRFDYIYPPALRYGTAALSILLQVSTARAYHLYTAILYVLGILGVYWLVWSGSRSRAQAWLSAAGAALVSPSLVLVPALGRDSPDWVPQRLHVLMTYGEGPHISALAAIGWALAFSWIALRRGGAPAWACAGAASAAVVANNFYGATALALFFPLLAWSVWIETRSPRVLTRAAAIAALAYGLCAFWLTPSYLRITIHNLRWVASPSKPWCAAVFAAGGALFALITYRVSKRRPLAAWPVFVIGAAIFFSIFVLGWYHFGFFVMGSAGRLAPELDLVWILLGAWLATLAWRKPVLRALAIALLALAAYPAVRYARHAWRIYPRVTDLSAQCEYQIPKWVHEHLPESRTLPAGSIRFWFDAWDDNAQAHGGSDQGLLNQLQPVANWMITRGDTAKLSILWLQALGADAVIVAGKNSPEIYHDYPHPERFVGALPVLYDDGRANLIYAVPRRSGLARVVRRNSLLATAPINEYADLGVIERYVSAVENGSLHEAHDHRSGPGSIDLEATVGGGEAVLEQETYDPSWRAYSAGRELAIQPDPLGFMLIEAPPGQDRIQLRFRTPIENRTGWGLTVASVLWIAIALYRERRVRLLSGRAQTEN